MQSKLEKEFEELVNTHKASIYSVCYMYSTDADEVSDLFQDCLVNIWQGLPGFNGKSSISTWIYRICLNTCISASRKKKKAGQRVPLEVTANLMEPTNQNEQQAKILHDRIQKLGPLDRAIVLMWLENMPYDEIGLIVGISPKNVGVRLYRIKERLKNM